MLAIQAGMEQKKTNQERARKYGGSSSFIDVGQRVGHPDRTKTGKTLSVPVSMSRGRRMVTVHSKESATAPLKKSMLFPSPTWLIPNRPRRIASKRVRSKWVGIGGASNKEGKITHEQQRERHPS